MTVGNFAPFLGTLGSDPLVDSFFADDNNQYLIRDNSTVVVLDICVEAQL